MLAAAIYHLQDTALVLAMLRDGLIELAFDCRENHSRLDCRENHSRLESLARKYADRSPELADLCLARMSELHPHHSVVTVDRADFKVYRRNKRESIPLIFPPEAS